MFKELFKVVEKIGRRDISEGREVVSTQYIKGKGWRNTFSDGTEEWDETAEILQPPKEIKGTKMHVAGYGGFDSEILDVPTALDDEGLADWFQTVIDDHSLDAPTPEEFVKGVRAGEVIFGDDEDGPIAFSQSKMKARKAVRQKAAEYAEDYEIEPRGGYVGSRPPTEGMNEAHTWLSDLIKVVHSEMRAIAAKYENEVVPDSYSPSEPDTSKFKAFSLGKVVYTPNAEETSGYGASPTVGKIKIG